MTHVITHGEVSEQVATRISKRVVWSSQQEVVKAWVAWVEWREGMSEGRCRTWGEWQALRYEKEKLWTTDAGVEGELAQIVKGAHGEDVVMVKVQVGQANEARQRLVVHHVRWRREVGLSQLEVVVVPVFGDAVETRRWRGEQIELMRGKWMKARARYQRVEWVRGAERQHEERARYEKVMGLGVTPQEGWVKAAVVEARLAGER